MAADRNSLHPFTWLESLANAAWLIDVARKQQEEAPLGITTLSAWEAERALVRCMSRSERYLEAELAKEHHA